MIIYYRGDNKVVDQRRVLRKTVTLISSSEEGFIMEKLSLIVSVNGANLFDEKFSEEQARVMVNEIGNSFIANIGDLKRLFGYTETYTKEEIADGVFKFTFTVNDEYEYFIYLAATAEAPVIPEHKFSASIHIKEMDKDLVCVLCNSKEALDFYRKMTNDSIADYYKKGGMGEIEMSYSYPA